MQCRIAIKGPLDPSWHEWFEDLRIAPDGPTKTVLSGPLVDQAALYRVLLKIRSLGLVLLFLETYEVDWEPEKERTKHTQ
ncbi:hypothetical protein [Tengunoibacter tsumagoiensis]|uniref:Uncharacterized protein n=1 Tax=Tengunoibacter tsumagoiensis TaxID=2014871 RepID=A0A402A9A9_9CHLR|nr:hypothetical protein [Tengunoibacter tsumagoiensis]GCE15531.1 hypothetical protein KTT_53900 [Tengunoibacter tsumagoiensis]